MSFKSKDDPRVQESYDFLSKNILVTSDQISGDLLIFWTDLIKGSEIEEDQPEWIIFIFALVTYNHSKNRAKFLIGIEELEHKYNQWQAMLIFINLCKLDKLDYVPIKIFDFDNYDKILLQVKRV